MMTWEEINAARVNLGLTESEMAKLLQVAMSTYTGWGQRGKVPPYMAASVEAHSLMEKRKLRAIMKRRGIRRNNTD